MRDVNDDPINVDVVWATLNQALATVNVDGLVTAVRAGTVQIVATYAGVGAAVEVTVMGVGMTPRYIQCRDRSGLWQDSGSCNYDAIPVNASFDVTFRVLDTQRLPIPGVVMDFDVDETVNGTMTQGGTVDPTMATTGGSGEVTVTWTIGHVPGDNRLLAIVQGLGSIGVWVKGLQNGSALSFDGVTQFVEAADADDLDLAAEWTIEAWVKPGNLSGGFQQIVSKWGGCAVASYSLELNGPKLRNAIASCANGTQVTESLSDLVVDEWQHVAVTLSGGTLRLFINGVEDNMRTGSQAPLPTTTPVSIGRQSGGSLAYGGLADEIRIWNVARSEAELASAKDIQLTGNEAGLVAYWQFNEEAVTP